jgi:hypothetical protein
LADGRRPELALEAVVHPAVRQEKRRRREEPSHDWAVCPSSTLRAGAGKQRVRDGGLAGDAISPFEVVGAGPECRPLELLRVGTALSHLLLLLLLLLRKWGKAANANEEVRVA